MQLGSSSAPSRSAADLESALVAALKAGVRALVALSSPLARLNQRRIDELALRHRLPSITMFPLLRDGQGFMSYGPDFDDLFRIAATYVDRTLKGARVGDLPVERPSKFELAVNQRTAKALGLVLPNSLVLRADRVLE